VQGGSRGGRGLGLGFELRLPGGRQRPGLGLLLPHARREVLGAPGIANEIDRVAAAAPAGAPVAGFYTYGEIARTRGLSGFHNQTLVVLAVA